jgi:hypothetical protein
MSVIVVKGDCMTIRSRVIFLTVGALALTPVASAAQSSSSVTFGVKLGVNSATIKTDDGSDYGMRLGAVGGLFLGRQINENVGVQIEGLYSQHGAKDKAAGSDIKYRVTYIDVPVLLRFGRTSFHLYTGPQIGYKLDAEASSKKLDLTVDLDDDVENLDLGWTVGASVERNRLSLDARYILGLKDISTDASSTDSAKNRTFTVLVGLRLK